MRKEVNNCVGCPPEIYCLGDGCPLRHSLEISCDRCGKKIVEDDCWQDEDETNDYCWKCACELGIIKDE